MLDARRQNAPLHFRAVDVGAASVQVCLSFYSASVGDPRGVGGGECTVHTELLVELGRGLDTHDEFSIRGTRLRLFSSLKFLK